MTRASKAIALLSVMGLGSQGDATDLLFSQMSYRLDGVSTRLTEYGRCRVDYAGTNGPLFFNLSVGGQWRIRNAPLLDYGPTSSVDLAFDLGTVRGSLVTGLNFGWSVTSSPGTMPGSTLTAPVTRATVVEHSGVQGEPLKTDVAPAPEPSSGDAANEWEAKHDGFPNQEAKEGECVPTAVSNSLKFLKKSKPGSFNPTDDEISRQTFRIVTGYHYPVAANANWAELVERHINQKHWPIKQTEIGSYREILEAVKRGADVIVQGTGHVVAVQGITYLGADEYALDLAEDTNQEDDQPPKPGETNRIVINGDGKVIEGGGEWTDNYVERGYIKEVVPEPATMVALGIGLIALAAKRRRASP